MPASGSEIIQPIQLAQPTQLAQPARRAEFINDAAGVLTETEFAELSQMLTRHNQQGPGRLLVCIIPRLPAGQNSRQYANSYLAAQEKLQTKGKWLGWNDRVLLLVVTNDRLIWLQARPAVWDILNSEERQRIIDQTIDPAILAGHFYQGIHAGIKAISHDLQTSPKPSVNYPQLAKSIALGLLRWVGFLLVLLLGSTILFTALHEAAHALVAWLVGLRVYRISIGYGRRLFEFPSRIRTQGSS